MKKILGLVFGLLMSLPAVATDEPLCNLYNKADGALNGYPSADLKWTTGGGERTIIMHLTEGETYTVKRVDGSSAAFRIEASDTQTLTSGQTLHSIYVTDDTSINTQTFTVPSGYPYVLFYIYNTQKPQITPQQAIDGFVLVKGSTIPSEYIEYNSLCATCEGTVKNYTSATGTVSQNGKPTPTNPIYPTFYKQGNMILRKVGDIADTYDASTGKITRRIGVKVLSTGNGCARFNNSMDVIACSGDAGLTNAKTTTRYALSNALTFNSGHYGTSSLTEGEFFKGDNSAPGRLYINFGAWTDTTLADFKSWIERQYVNGNPVTIWYPLETPTEETVSPTTYCDLGIKVATKKYSDSKFNPVMTALNSAITTIKTVVTNTINQAAAVESLQNGKQTMPNASATNGTCPNYKQCLLVETSDGTPQWFVITDPFRDFVAPILATNTNGTTSTNDPGYQQVEYIEKRTGSVFIDTGFVLSSPDTSYNQDVQYNMEFEFTQNPASGACLFGAENSSEGGYSGLWYFISNSSASLFTGNSGNMTTVGFTAGNKYSITIKVKNHKVEAYVDGTRVFYGGYSGVLGNNPIYVLGLYDLEHDGPYYNTPTKYIKIYKFQIIENGVLVFDGIPVRNLANSRIGLYDTVSRGFFGDASGDSTGFYAGSNVTNDPDVPANPTWSVTWSNNGNGVAGIVYGEGVCNAVAGTYAVAATSANLSASGWSQSGGSCWCKTTGATVNQESTPVSSAPWVFIGTRGSAAGCANRCAGDCVDSVRANAAFRTAIFNTGS